MKYSVLLDTSFFIRLLSNNDPLHNNAKGYFQYFLEEQIPLKISTISIAEYCVRGDLSDLPLRNLEILPFNLDQATKTGEFARVIFKENGRSINKISPRNVIPNDSKLFAQADLDKSIHYFVTSDTSSNSAYNHLKKQIRPQFEILDISKPHHEMFGILDLK